MNLDLYQVDKRQRIAFFKSLSFEALAQEVQTHIGLAYVLISDLLTVDDYSEMTIAFGLRVSLDKIRNMMTAPINELTLREKLSLVGFYLRVFDREGQA